MDNEFGRWLWIDTEYYLQRASRTTHDQFWASFECHAETMRDTFKSKATPDAGNPTKQIANRDTNHY